MILIFGEASSGKSRYAESRLSELSGSPKIYVATSEVYDAEMMRRVEIHQAMRADKGFLTIEKTRDLGAADLPERGAGSPAKRWPGIAGRSARLPQPPRFPFQKMEKTAF